MPIELELDPAAEVEAGEVEQVDETQGGTNTLYLVGVSEENDDEASTQEEETAEAAPPTPEPAAPQPANATSDLLVQIYNAEFACARAEAIVEERKADLKAAKDHYDGCVDKLRELARHARNDSPENRPLFANLEAKTEAAEDATREEEPADASTPTEPAWKSLTVDALPDITPKTKEQLRDGGINTLTDLAELITRCEHDSTQAWPKGIGKVKQEMIVAALVTVQDLERCEGNEGVEVTEVSAVYPTTEEWDGWDDGTQINWLNERALELEEAYPDASQVECDAGSWEAGTKAAINGEGIANCELTPGLECDAWLLGWLWQSKQEDVEAEETDDADAEE